MNVVFIPDTDPKNGLGHISRCAALHEQLKLNLNTANFFAIGNINQLSLRFKEINFAADITNLNLNPSETFLVIDDYNYPSENLEKFKAAGHKVVVIDDFGTTYSSADLIINHGLIRENNSTPAPNYLYGFEYLMLHPLFQHLNSTDTKSSKQKILISFGGSGQLDLTQKWLSAAEQVFNDCNIVLLTPNSKHDFKINSKSVDFIWGLSSAELNSLFNSLDLAIVPSSNLSLEVAATNCKLASGYFVDNQKFIYNSLISKNICFDLGDLNIPKEQCIERLKDLKNELVITSSSSAKTEISSSKAGKAIANQFLALYKGLTIRNANWDDCQFIYDLANDDSVRENSITAEPIPWESHVNWFKGKLNSNDLFHIYEFNNRAIGYVRIEDKNPETIISIALSNSMRGKKMAPTMIACSSDFYLSILGNDAQILAYIWDKNPASAVSFERAGYIHKEQKIISERTFSILSYGR